MLPKEHDAVNERWQKEQPKLQLPGELKFVIEHPSRGAAEHQPRRPTCVQQIQVVSAVVREKCRYQRIGHRLEGSISHCKDERPPEEKLPNRLLGHARARCEGHKCREHMKCERGNHQLAVADLIRDDSADDDAEAKTSETSSTDVAQLGRCEAKLRTPVVKDATANGKTHSCSQDGHKPGPKQQVCIRCSTAVVSALHGLGVTLIFLAADLIFWSWDRRPVSAHGHPGLADPSFHGDSLSADD